MHFLWNALPSLTESHSKTPKDKSRTVRRIVPMYYCRLDLPDGFAASGYTSLQREGECPDRAVFRTDGAGRYMHVLYFPQKESRNEQLLLHFGSQPNRPPDQ